MLPVLTHEAVLWLRVGDEQFRTPMSKGLWFNDYGYIRKKEKKKSLVDGIEKS